MKTEWDYTDLAEAYLKRLDYAASAVDEMLRIVGVKKRDGVCDVGAGAARLTRLLAQRGFAVSAVETNVHHIIEEYLIYELCVLDYWFVRCRQNNNW